VAQPALYAAMPNPFNPTPIIRYDVPSPGAHVRIVVYDVTGRRVATLVDGQKSGGQKRVTWNGRNDRGNEVATGVYFYRMTVPGFTQTRKMVLVK
jgi:flagellar hook assembly protein FlgD